MLPLLLAMQRKGKRQRQKAKAKGKQLMPSFAFGCSTFAFDYASKGKRRKDKRGALFLCLQRQKSPNA
jgi:hypothetical protein